MGSQTDECINVHNSPNTMLAIIGIILILCWLLGLTMHIAGGFIHLVLFIALVMVAMHFIRGKKVE